MAHQTLTLPPARTTLLLIDMQEEHRLDSRYLVAGYDDVAANCARLLAAARGAGLRVVHSVYLVEQGVAPRPFHPVMADGTSAFSAAGTPGSEISAEVRPAPDEAVVIKGDASCFAAPALIPAIADAEWLVIAGCWAEACVAATVKDAVDRGIRVLLVKDAIGSGSRAMQETAVLNMANRLYGGAVADTARALSLMAGGAARVWRTDLPVPVKFTYETASADYAAL